MVGLKMTESVVRDTLLPFEKATEEEESGSISCSSEAIRECMTGSWTQKPLLKRHTFKTRVIHLPVPHFEDWLNKEGLHLPPSEVTELSTVAEKSLLALRKEMEECIAALDGDVFPKLNFSAPVDAAWMALDGTMKCRSADDIFILLKSSDRLQHDRAVLRETGDAPTLILKKYYELNKSMEFRCFVRENRLIGTCHSIYLVKTC